MVPLKVENSGFRKSGSAQESDEVAIWQEFREFGVSGDFGGSVSSLVAGLVPAAAQ